MYLPQGSKIIPLLFLSLVLTISFSFALEVGIDSELGIDLIPDVPINYSLIPTVNSSDFWDDLDSPADISHADLLNLEWSVAGHTIDTNIDMNDNQLTDMSILILSAGGYMGSWDGELEFASNVSPYSSLYYDLGSGTNRWLNLYVQNINAEYIGAFNLVASENVTANYFVGDGSLLTGISGGVPRWLNNSNNIYLNSSYPQNINISGNATFGGGAIFKGAIEGDDSLGYKNIRFGVFAGTPRIIFDNGSSMGAIDWVGNTLRFYEQGEFVTLRLNSTAGQLGQAGRRRDLILYGDLIGIDPAGGGSNIDIDGNLTTTGTVTGEQLTSTDNITMAGKFHNVVGSTDTIGFELDQYTNGYTGTSTNYLMKLRKDIDTADGSSFFTSYGIDNRLYNSYALTSPVSRPRIKNYVGSNYMQVTGSHTITTSEYNHGLYNYLFRGGTINTNAGATTIYNYGMYNEITDSLAVGVAGSELDIYNYGGYFEASSNGGGFGGTLVTTTYGFYSKITGGGGGTKTGYGAYLDGGVGFSETWGFYNDMSAGDNFLGADNIKTYLGTGKDASISYDNTNMIFRSNETGEGLAWFSRNVSATSFITRSNVYDKSKGSALDLIKDSDDWREIDGTLNKQSHYAFVEYNITDFSRPVNKSYVCNVTDEKTQKEVESICYRLVYPYKIKEQGFDVETRIATLEQAVYELKIQNQDLLKRIEVLEGK